MTERSVNAHSPKREKTSFAMYQDDIRELIERIKDDVPIHPKLARLIANHCLKIMQENAAESAKQSP